MDLPHKQDMEMPKEHEKMKFMHHFEEKSSHSWFMLIWKVWQFQETTP